MFRRLPVFTRTTFMLGLAGALTIASMLQYPGGTTLDHSTVGYSVQRNFLSDLGMTVAFDGRPNFLGALLFVLGLITAIAGLGAGLLELVRRCSASAPGRAFARSAAVLGLVASLAFLGVAFTPENRVMELHIDFTFLAFRLAPVVTLLLTLGLRASGAFSAGLTYAFAALTSVLVAYVVILEWGPPLTNTTGLVTQVVAQKLVVITAVLVFIYASANADQVVARHATGHDSQS